METNPPPAPASPAHTGMGRKALILIALVIAAGTALYMRGQNVRDTDAPPPLQTSVPPPGGAPAPLPRLVDLGAGKCVPCKAMAPILEELKQTYAGQLEVVFIDVWEKPDEADKYKINIIPTQIFYDSTGTERFRHEGFFSREDILDKWKELGVTLPATAIQKAL